VVGWNAAEAILAAARPEQASMIVIASHGRGGLTRLALGSVADKLVRGADVPVLVQRPAGRQGRGRAASDKPTRRGR
jgi:nucleotide-binding universal stress UspA family protein